MNRSQSAGVEGMKTNYQNDQPREKKKKHKLRRYSPLGLRKVNPVLLGFVLDSVIAERTSRGEETEVH